MCPTGVCGAVFRASEGVENINVRGASGGLGAYLHPERVPRAGARGVAWRLLSRVKGAVFCGYPA